MTDYSWSQTLVEKVCKACGKRFTTKCPQQKYCEGCSPYRNRGIKKL